MILEVLKSTTGFNRATLYEVMHQDYSNAYFEGKTAFADLKKWAKGKGFTNIVVISNNPDKWYTL